MSAVMEAVEYNITRAWLELKDHKDGYDDIFLGIRLARARLSATYTFVVGLSTIMKAKDMPECFEVLNFCDEILYVLMYINFEKMRAA